MNRHRALRREVRVMSPLGKRSFRETMAHRQRPVGLVRGRLLAALDADRNHRLGLVVAPAGSGKTTLLMQYAWAFDGPVWWYVIEPGDASAATFCRGLAATLGGMLGGDPVTVDCTTVDDLVRLLADSPPSSGLLVIDDLHRVAQTPAETALGSLLSRSPSWLRVLVGSRSVPSFNLSQYELSDIAVIDAEQLRFRAWEVESLLRDVYGEPLPPDDAATLSRRVDGWAAGLHMFHLSTLGRPLAERRHALAALDGRSRRIRDYLAATVLAELPETTRDFLVRTCVFDRVTPDRCRRLLGNSADVQDILADLERRQAFTTSDDGGVSFRYHEVLRAHLRLLLTERLGERGARQWYARAGALLETDGHPSEAIRAYAHAEDWHAVRRLVSGVGPEFSEDFAKWRDVLPAWLVAEDPWLILAEGRYWLNRGQIARAVDMFRQAESLAQDESVRASCRAARARASVWLSNGAGHNATPLPARHPLSRLRAAVRGDVHGIQGAYLPAMIDAPGESAAITAIAAAAQNFLAGNVRAARRTVDDAIALVATDDSVPVVALRLLQTASQLATDAPGADERLARIAVEVERGQSPWLGRLVRAASAFDRTDNGIKEARAAAEECLRDGDAWGAVLAESAAVLAGIMNGDFDADGLRALAVRCIELDARALAAWAQAYAAWADQSMAHGQEMAGLVSGDPVMTESDAGVTTPGTIAVRRIAAARGDGSAQSIAAARSAAITAGLPADHVDALLAPGTRTLLAAQTPIRVRCFGGFAMDLPGRTLDWTAIKPRTRMALRLLAMHGGRPVHRDVLMAALWPDVDPSSATRNLHVALSSLRTFFDPGLPRGRCQLIVRSGDAYELALPPDGELDVVLFTNAIAAARRAQLDGNVTVMRGALRKALGLYSGDLLPEDGAAEWVATTRESYRQQAAAAAEQLAAAELDAGDDSAALTAAERCLAIDTYRDQAWRLMIEAQRHLGNHAAADRAGRDYAAMLASLGLAPSGKPLLVSQSAPVPAGQSTKRPTELRAGRGSSPALIRQRTPSAAGISTGLSTGRPTPSRM